MTKSSSPPRPRRSPTTWQRLLLVAVGVGLVVALLALVEGALAVLGVGEDYLYDDPFVGFAPGDTLFTPEEGPDGRRVYATRPAKLAFFNPQEFPVEKAPGTLRIFVLGGSTAAGRPYDDRVSFARWLERYLDAAEPTREHEVINAAGISYASYRVALLMRELVRYQPDVFVVYTGHNEFLEKRTYGDLLQRNPTLLRAQMWLSGFRIAALMRQVARGLGREDPRPSRLEAEVITRLEVWRGLESFERDAELSKSIVEHFGFNLERMVALARRAGAEVVLVAPVSNLKDFSPFKSELGASLTPKERARFATRLEAGKRLLSEGDAGRAIGPLQEAVELDATHAEARFRLGRARFELGEIETARSDFVAAKDLDVVALRALESLVERVRVTARRLDVPLVDLPSLLADQMLRSHGQPILGNELLLDHVHPDIPVQARIAEELMGVLSERVLVQLGPDWTEARRRKIYDNVVSSLDRYYYAQRDLNLGKVLGWAGKTEEAEAPLLRAAEVLGGDPDLLINLGILQLRMDRPEAAAETLERALASAPTSAVRLNLGVAYGRLGRPDDGIAELRKAIRLRPEWAEAHYNLGVLLRDTGRVEVALEALRRAVALDPAQADAYRALGRTLRDAGQLEQAERALREALRRGDSAVDRTELAITLAEARRPAEAEAEVEKALALDPGYPGALYAKARLRAESGQSEEAMAAYRDVLAVAPRHARAHNNLGILLAAAGGLVEAEAELLAAIEADPTWAEAYLNLGVVYDRRGEPQAAIRAVERSHELAPEEPRIRLALGLLYQEAGDPAAARPHLEAAQAAGLSAPLGNPRAPGP